MLAVPQHHVAHVAHAQAVHHHGAGGHRVAQLDLVLGQDDVGAVLRDEDVAVGDAQAGRGEGVLFQLLVFAVDRQEILGSGQGQHQLLLFLAGVARDVDVVHALIDHLGAQQQQAVDDLGDALFVAGDGVGRDDDEIPRAHPHLAVAAGRHPGQSAQRLALAAGGDQDHLVGGVAVQLVDVDEGALRDVHIAQLLGHGGVVDHAAAAEGHLAALLDGQVDDLLDAVDVGRKGGDDDPLVPRLGEQVVDAGGHLLLGGGEAGALGVGGVAQQGQHPPLAVLGQGGQVGGAAGQGGVVDLEVAGLDHHAGGAVDGKAHRVGDGVVDVDGLHGEAPQMDLLPGHDLHKAGAARQVELLQLVADQAQRQLGAVDRQVQLLQQVGDAADVVLVAVGDQQALDPVLVLQNEGEVRDDHVDAVHLAVGEHQAAVHDDHVAAALIDGHVLAHFAQAAQRVDVDGDGRPALGGLGPAGPPGIHGAAALLGAVVRAGIVPPCAGRAASILFCCCHLYLQDKRGRVFCPCRWRDRGARTRPPVK